MKVVYRTRKLHRTPNGFVVEWPDNVPRDNDEFVKEFAVYIERKILPRFNKVERNIHDLRQHIWEKLLATNFLDKFVNSASRRLLREMGNNPDSDTPATMTAEQAAAYLGVTWTSWTNMIAKRTRDPDFYGWLPMAIEGTDYSKVSVYCLGEIIALDESGYFRKQGERTCPKVSGRGFKAYLQQTVKNHFANWCRHHSRRYKEQLLTPTTVLAQNSDGSHHQASRIEDYSAWETTLVASTFDDGEILDAMTFAEELQKAFADADLDLSAINDTDEDGRPTPEAKRGLAVLDYVSEGGFDLQAFMDEDYTIREAIQAQIREAIQAQNRFEVRQARRQKHA